MARRRTHRSEPTLSEDVLADEGQGLTDLIKRMAYLGVGTVFATQETASRMVKDLKLPREAVQTILNVAERNRDEVVRAITRTMKEFLDEVDLITLLRQSLNGMRVEVKAEFGFRIDEPDPKKSAAPKKPSRKRG